MPHTTRRYIPFLIATLYLAVAIISVQFDDVTYDEADHLQYGIHLLKFRSDRYVPGKDFNTTMPVTALNALPRAAEQLIHKDLHKTDWGDSDVKSGRYISILISLLLLTYIFLFAQSLAGFAGGCWAMFLTALDPNILAHSRLVTTDIYATLALVATLYHLHEWLANKKKPHFLYWCIAIGIAQCCKINNILLYPVCLFAILAYRKNIAVTGNKYLFAGRQLLIFILLQLLVINVFFLFYRTGLPLQDYQFRSTFFQQLQQGFIARIPLPLPKPFIDTFDLVQYERESFEGTALNYLSGELHYKKGFPGYYFFCWLLKTPLFTQLLVLAFVVMVFLQPMLRKSMLFFFAIPAFFIFILLSTSAVQSGYRYLLPVLSLTLVFAGAGIPWLLSAFKRRINFLTGITLAIPLIVAFTAFPNYIAYTNELIWQKKNAYLYFADSNLNWGQRDKQVQHFMAQHPDYIFEPVAPCNGMIVVDINKLTGTIETARFEWLRNHYRPVATFAHCFLIFKVDDQPRQVVLKLPVPGDNIAGDPLR